MPLDAIHAVRRMQRLLQVKQQEAIALTQNMKNIGELQMLLTRPLCCRFSHVPSASIPCFYPAQGMWACFSVREIDVAARAPFACEVVSICNVAVMHRTEMKQQ